MEPNRSVPRLEGTEWNAANGLTTLERPDLSGRLGHQKHAVHPRQGPDQPAQRRANLARLVSYALGFLFDTFEISIDPCRGPVFDLDDLDPGRANGDDVDLVRLTAVGRGESQVCQQDPLVVPGLSRQAGPELLECLALALVDGRPARDMVHFHGHMLLDTRGQV